MGVWTLAGRIDGSDHAAVMVDSVTMRAFGPIFADGDEVDGFIAWAHEVGAGDPRKMTSDVLDEAVRKFRESLE